MRKVTKPCPRISPSSNRAARSWTFASCGFSATADALFLAKRTARSQISSSGPGRREQIGDALKYIREKAAIESVPEVRITLGDMLTTGDMAFPRPK